MSSPSIPQPFLEAGRSWQPLPLPRISIAQARACTAIAQCLQQIPVDIGARWEARLRPVPPGDVSPPSAMPENRLVRIRWDGGVFHIQVPAASLHACLQAYVPDMPLPAVSGPLANAVLEGVLASVQQALGIAGAAISCLDSPASHASDPGMPGFLLELTGPGTTMPLTLLVHVDDAGLAALARHAARRPCLSNAIDLSDVPVTLLAVVGETQLEPAMIASLETHDAVLIERYFVTDGDTLPLQSASGWSLMSIIDDNGLCSTAEWHPDMLRSAARPPDVRLNFDIGHVMLPLQRLIELTQEEGLVAALPALSEINLRMDGTVIGQGELVELDGRPAVILLRRCDGPD